MSRSGTSRHRDWRRWPAISLVIAIFFLGHDVLMALPVHTADESRAHASGHPAMVHDVAAGEMSSVLVHPASGHPDECGILTIAAPWPGQRMGLAGPPGVQVDPVIPWTPPGLAGSGAIAWDQPHAPPGVRRALLQVYLL